MRRPKLDTSHPLPSSIATDLPSQNLLEERLPRLAPGKLELPARVGLDASHYHNGTDRVSLLAARERGQGLIATRCSSLLSFSSPALLLWLFSGCRRPRRRLRRCRCCSSCCSAALGPPFFTARGGDPRGRNCADTVMAGADAGRVQGDTPTGHFEADRGAWPTRPRLEFDHVVALACADALRRLRYDRLKDSILMGSGFGHVVS